MAGFPTLKTGAAAQYPLDYGVRFSSPVVVPDDVCQPPAPGAAGTTAES